MNYAGIGPDGGQFYQAGTAEWKSSLPNFEALVWRMVDRVYNITEIMS